MKKFLVLLILLLNSCAKPRETWREELFSGEHKLKRLTNLTGKETTLSGGFFLFVGSLAAKTKESCLVKFAWQLNNGSYAISSLPLEQIRIRLIKEIKPPTVKFRWKKSGHLGWPLQDNIDTCIIYAEITVQERNWQSEYEYPLDKSQ